MRVSTIYQLSRILLLNLFVCCACDAGTFWDQNFYFPPKSLPEDNWNVRATVSVESGLFRRFKDVSDKSYRIVVRNKKGDLLYSESGRFRAGFIEAKADWEKMESIKIVVSTEDGPEIFKRLLEYDSKKHVYVLKEGKGRE
jgi:hypothetical protein